MPAFHYTNVLIGLSIDELPDLRSNLSTSIELGVSAIDTPDSALSRLNTLQAQDRAYKQVAQAVSKAAKYEQQGNVSKALAEMIKASDHLIKVSHPDADAIRKALAIIIRDLGMRL